MFVRSIIIGLLDLLNNKLQINQVIDKTSASIPVPFFYGRFGQERFLQDFFFKYQEGCDGPVYVEGGAEPVPRGSITMSSLSVNPAALTSKFTRGTYNKEVNGQVQAFNSMLNVIPITIQFNAEVICNTLLESLKISQAVIGTFYKAEKFEVDYAGFMVPCQAGFSEDFQTQKQLEYTYGNGEDKIITSFTIETECYMPVPDITTERWRGNVMNSIGNIVSQDSKGNYSAEFLPEVPGYDPRFKLPNIQNNVDSVGNPVNFDEVPPLDPDINGIPPTPNTTTNPTL